MTKQPWVWRDVREDYTERGPWNFFHLFGKNDKNEIKTQVIILYVCWAGSSADKKFPKCTSHKVQR